MLIRLLNSGDKKIEVIKLVKNYTQLSLADSKKIIDEVPSVFEISDRYYFSEIEKIFSLAGAEIQLVENDFEKSKSLSHFQTKKSTNIQTIKILKIQEKNRNVKKLIKKYSGFGFFKTLKALNNIPFTFTINTYKISLIEFKNEANANNIDFEIIGETQNIIQTTPNYIQKNEIIENTEYINLKITIISVSSKLEFIKNVKNFFVCGLKEAKELTDIPHTVFYCTIPTVFLTQLHQQLSIANSVIEIEQVKETNPNFPFFEFNNNSIN